MDEKASEQVFTQSDKDIITTTQLSSCAASADVPPSITSPRRRILQNHRVIWFDVDIDESSEFYQNTITQLQTIVNSVDTFTDLDECVDYLTDIIQEKVFMIMSETINKQIIPLLHDISVLDSIYMFSDNESKEEGKLVEDWPKVKSEYTEITSICEAIRQAVRRCDQNSIPISFISADDGTSNSNLDELDSSFMYTQIFKEILLDAEYNQQSIKDLILYWRPQYIGNTHQLKIIDEFEREYRSELSIWWYTRHSFTYDMLNRALRTMEADIIIKMGFFIRDLHHQLEKLHAQQFVGADATSFTVFRGQGLSNTDFEKLMKTKGGLISFNNFLSTSEDRPTSLFFAESTLANPGLIGILFKITIDPSISSTPYARISSVSGFNEEEEILFSMHSVFRIGEIEKIDNNDQLYQVELKLTADDDQQLRALTNLIRKETFPSAEGWYRMSILLIKVGQFQQAEEVCMAAQEELSDDIKKVFLYNVLGMIKNGQGDYKKAVFFYEKTVEITEKILPPNDPDLATPYNNLALTYFNKGERPRALSFLEKALKIRQKGLPANHPLLAISYNNIGRVYQEIGQHSKAISFIEKALKIQEDNLPPNHPNLADSYSNIAGAYMEGGENSKALSFFEKALKIMQIVLPPTHPDLARSYSNIGIMYIKMGEYSKALSFHEKAHEIRKISLPPTHLDLATSFSNIGSVYDSMGEYSKALLFYEKTLEIRKIAPSPTHPDLATSYGNIGSVYKSMGEYSKALSFHEKALEIKKIALLPTHPSLATSYGNIGSVHDSMGEYSKALLFYEKALEIMQISLPPTHPDLANSYNNIGSAYKSVGEYSKALPFLEKALEIRKIALPSTHPDLAISYGNIGSMYKGMEEYSKALSFLEKALEIQQKTLPPTHPDLATSYSHIGSLYNSMGEYSKALSFCKKDLEIIELALPPTHPDLATSYSSIGLVYHNLKEYLKALCFQEKALKILQQILPENHISFVNLYINISKLYFRMKEYSTSLSYSERALQIGQKSLPANHSALQVMRDNITRMKGLLNDI